MPQAEDITATPAPVPTESVSLAPPRRWAVVEDRVSRHFWVPVLAVFALGLLSRIIVALPTMLNPDEAMHVFLSDKPSIWQMYLNDLKGPDPSLLHLILFPLIRLSASDFVLRLPSILAGALAALFMYLWLRELFDRTTGLIGMILLGFAPALIFISAEIRAYALLLFFSLAALYCFEAAMRRGSMALMLLFGLGQCLALLSQYSALLLLFAAGFYSLYLALRRRIRGRLLLSWLAAEILTVGLLLFQYFTHISRLHGSAVEGDVKSGFLSQAYFNPTRDKVMSFILTRTTAAFKFLFTSWYIGYVALGLFAAGALLILLRGYVTDGRRSRRPISFLLLAPWALAALGGLLSVYPFGGTRHIVLLMVFAAAGIAFLLRHFVGPRPGVVLLAATVIVPVWNLTRFDYAGGWWIDHRQLRRTQIEAAVDVVHQALPEGGIVFSSLESSYPFRRYLFKGHSGTARSAPPSYYEYDWGGYRMVTLKSWLMNPDLLGDEIHRMAESYGLQPGDTVCVASCGWGSNLAGYNRRHGRVYPGAHEFSYYIATIVVPVGTEPLSDTLSERVSRIRGTLNSLAYRLSHVMRRRAEMVLWPSSYLDSTANEIAGRLALQTMSYHTFYDVAAAGQLPFDELLPGLAFWVFGTSEAHAGYMSYMERGQDFVAGDHRFTLIAADPDRLTAVYLIEPSQEEPR